MDGVCGVFRPDLIPDWLSKSGPAIAAFVAVFVYSMNRWHARRDLNAKRSVLRAMLFKHIERALLQAFAMQQPSICARHLTPRRIFDLARVGVYSILGTDRLLELQCELLRVADYGDDAIAVFLEALHIYQKDRKSVV